MKIPRLRIQRWVGLLAVCFVALLPAAGSRAQYTPQHDYVQGMVNRGVGYLNGLKPGGAGGGYGLGSQVLVAYTLLKATGDYDSPMVKQGIAAAQRLSRSLATYREQGESKIVYEVCIAGVFLASLDAAKYQPELVQIREWLLDIQKSHGGFGYLGKPTGDTSQVQYVMLALWTMQQAKMDVPVDAVEASARYIRATMDPTGTWGYDGIIGNGSLVKQEKVSKSLGTAGAGALIIAGDILSIFGARKSPQEEAEGIPSAFKRVDLIKDRRVRARVEMTRSDFENPLKRARQYQNASRFSGSYWYYYWRYSQERYESFVEIVEGKQQKSPAWYNQGVEELAKLQDSDGSWGTTNKRDFYPPDVCTSFSILFLIRSTQKAIGVLDEGQQFGGYLLPNDLTNVQMVGNKLVGSEQASVESLLSMLEDDAASGVEEGLLPKHMKLDADPAKRKLQVARLSRLLVSHDWKARRVAARLLGRSDDLSVVPDLIFAISDPDPLVPMIAEESLRLLSRKLSAGKLGAEPDREQQNAAIRIWKKWYLGLKPDYIFIERKGGA